MARRNGKYNARKVKADGYTFDSRAEYARYCELKLLLAARVIADLSVHPRYTLQEAFTDGTGRRQRAVTYEADFTYIDGETGGFVVEDVKGVQTPVFKLKWKLLMYRYRAWDFRIVPA